MHAIPVSILGVEKISIFIEENLTFLTLTDKENNFPKRCFWLLLNLFHFFFHLIMSYTHISYAFHAVCQSGLEGINGENEGSGKKSHDTHSSRHFSLFYSFSKLFSSAKSICSSTHLKCWELPWEDLHLICRKRR